MKKAKHISALLLCLTCLLVFTAPAFATNTGAAVVNKVYIQLSAPPVVMMDPGKIQASTSTTGCSLVSMTWYDVSSQPITDAFTTDPTTLVLNIAGYGGYVFAENAAAYINGEPVSSAVGGGGAYITLVKEYTPSIWAPAIIKHPGDDKVDEDGTVSFVATADYADKSSWRVLDQNGQLWTLDQLAEAYPDFNYHDTLGRLVMNHVPRELDGAEFCCTFEGVGGKVDTNWATLKVNYEPEETPAPTPSPTPTPAPSRSPAPSPKPTPKTETHTHDFSSAWESDDAAHWHECDCGEQRDFASHSFTWETVEPATRKAPGKEKGVCTVCGYEKERELKYKGFSFDENFSFDEFFTDENIIKLIIIAAAALLLLVIVLIIATKIKRKRELERRRIEALRRRKQQRARREYEE